MEIIENPEIELQKVQKTIAELEATPDDEVAKNLADGIYDWDRTFFAIRRLVRSDYQFKTDELIKLGRDNPYSEELYGTTMLFELIRQGYRLTMDELLTVMHITDETGSTAAHWMAIVGHKFSIDEIHRLGNPADSDKRLIPHYMAMAGHVFSNDELELFGDPEDKFGLTISYWMKVYREIDYQEKYKHYYLTYQDSKTPIFKLVNKNNIFHGEGIHLSWSYRVADDIDVFGNVLNIFLTSEGLAKIENYVDSNLYNHPYRRMKALEWAVQINEAIKNHQEIELPNYYAEFDTFYDTKIISDGKYY